MAKQYETIRLDRDGGVATLTMDRPPLNVLNIAMMREMNDALAALAGDPTLRVLVIRGEGKAFSAGVDVADHTADKVEEMITVFHDIFRNMARIHAPIVAAVKGAALGGGCEVALFADIVLASERAKFGQPEVQVGVFPPIAAVMLPHITDRQRALELVLTGDVIKADEAHRIGLVNKVLPFEGFEEAADGYVAKLSGLSAPVLQASKRAVTEAMGLPFEEALQRVEDIYLKELMATQDAHEGLSAFLEKRKPVWRDE